PKTCFNDWREAKVDLDGCTAPKDGEVTNVTLVTSSTGDCDEDGKCFVPIDRGDDGWRDEGDRVRLPKGVCKKVREGAILGFVGGATCAQKTASLPVCNGGPSRVETPDAGGSDSGDADAGNPVEQLVLANGISGLVAYANRLYYGNADGLFVVQG